MDVAAGGSTASRLKSATAPRLAVGTVRVDRGRTIILRRQDDHSPILRVEFSQDGQRWRGVFPVDGIPTRAAAWLVVDGERVTGA
jgi:hypothetical protein